MEIIKSLNMPVSGLQKNTCAFVTSNFGFGPVSKAVTIAEEIKRRFPQIEIHFFGDDIALQFAKQSQIFDSLKESGVEETFQLEKILPQLKNYDFVFSVLNLTLLPLWSRNFGKLFFVDSLAWLWKEPPAGIENTEIYFVQDYLVPPNRIERWKKSYRIAAVPPIVELPQNTQSNSAAGKRSNCLLVNFSGCSNQYVDEKVYEKYTETLLKFIVKEAHGKFETIKVCVNQRLAEKLNKNFHYKFLKIGQLPKKEFLRCLAESRFLLTAPGVTTTLEAIATNTPLSFLLPQNDSQAVLSELYRLQTDESLSMAFSRFDRSLAFPLSLDEFENLRQPIDLAVEKMVFILENHQIKLQSFVAEILSELSIKLANDLKYYTRQSWTETGQSVIVEQTFCSGESIFY